VCACVCARAKSVAAGRCEPAKTRREDRGAAEDDRALPCDLTSEKGSARWEEKCLVEKYRGVLEYQ